MEVTPGYKLTEVGVIPEEWSVEPFSRLANIERGKFTARPRNDPKYYGGDIPFIQTGDVTNSNGTIRTYAQTLNTAGLKVSKLFPRGTLFFTIAANIGDVGFATFDTACPDSLVAITATKSCNAVWLSHELARRKPAFESIATHNAQLNINLEKLRSYLLPRPPLPEQHAIAGALTDVDELLGGLDRLIAKKRDLKQAAVQQLLTGRIRLPGFHREWDDIELGHIVTIRNAKIVASSTPAGTQCVELESISQSSGRLLGSVDAIGSSAKYRFKKGDVLFGRLRAYLKKYWLATFDGVCSTEIWPLIPCGDRLCASFLYLLVQTREFANAAGVSYGTHMPRSDWSVLRNLVVKAPPRPEQIAIAAVLSDMDAELAALEARRDKTRAVKQAMSQELLTGRTRLIERQATAVAC